MYYLDSDFQKIHKFEQKKSWNSGYKILAPTCADFLISLYNKVT